MKVRTKKLTLIYRAMLRQNTDISDKFAETGEKLKEVFPDAKGRPISEYHHPIFSSDLEQYQEEGYVVTTFNGQSSLIVREQHFDILGGDPRTGLVQIEEKMPDTFAVAVVSEDYSHDWIGK